MPSLLSDDRTNQLSLLSNKIFNAAIFVSNLQTLIVSEQELLETTKNRKLAYKVNTNLSYGFLKNRIITLVLSNRDIDKIVNQLKVLLKENLTPIDQIT